MIEIKIKNGLGEYEHYGYRYGCTIMILPQVTGIVRAYIMNTEALNNLDIGLAEILQQHHKKYKNFKGLYSKQDTKLKIDEVMKKAFVGINYDVAVINDTFVDHGNGKIAMETIYKGEDWAAKNIEPSIQANKKTRKTTATKTMPKSSGRTKSKERKKRVKKTPPKNAGLKPFIKRKASKRENNDNSCSIYKPFVKKQKM